MKKIKINNKLDLDKMTVAKLNDDQMQSVAGGGFLSIGKNCTGLNGGCCPCEKSNGIFCSH